jgi:alpha-ketoglutarate-dependent taurine dioxygenase
MTATTHDGPRALGILTRHKWPDHLEEISWHEGKVLIVDNWHVLHGRAQADGPEADRKLVRILIR